MKLPTFSTAHSLELSWTECTESITKNVYPKPNKNN